MPVLSGIPLEHHEKLQRDLGAAVTDRKGHFQIRDVLLGTIDNPDEVLLLVVARAAGRLPTSSWSDLNRNAAEDWELYLRPADTLQGRVTNDQGKPVAGAIISMPNGITPTAATKQLAITDADGRYRIHDLENFDAKVEGGPARVHPSGTFNAHSSHTGPCTAFVHHPDYSMLAVLFDKVPGTMNVVLPRGAAINGTITLASDRKPLTDARLMVYDGKTAWPRWVRTDAQGHYALDGLPPGKYDLLITHKEKPKGGSIDSLQLQPGKHHLDLQITESRSIKTVPR